MFMKFAFGFVALSIAVSYLSVQAIRAIESYFAMAFSDVTIFIVCVSFVGIALFWWVWHCSSFRKYDLENRYD